jgi:hypothetical protein
MEMKKGKERKCMATPGENGPGNKIESFGRKFGRK